MARKKSKQPSDKKKGGLRDNGTQKSNPGFRGNHQVSVVPKTTSFIGAGVVALLAIVIFSALSLSNNDLQSKIQNDGGQTPKEAFLKWFVDNGGTFYPIGLGKDRTVNVTIGEFPSYGGWGLALPIPPASCPPSKGGGDCPSSSSSDGEQQCETNDEHSPILIKHLDPLFTVPSSIIISVESILDTYASPSSPLYLSDFYRVVNKILTNSFPRGPGLAKRGMGLVQQDVVIAMYLMVEDCVNHHSDLFHNDSEEGSRWGPYLDVLPQYTIPRLDTFGDEEYAALRDENLEYTGRNSKRLLEEMYFKGDNDGGTNSLKTVVIDMIQQKNGSKSSPLDIPESCISFETFHRFVAIVSSRAMVLKGVKHLTPLAEMINYSPKLPVESNDEGKDLIRAPFDLYHTLSEDNSITVRSDRDIFLTDTDADTGAIQIFEDYGPVDSSLFLEAHGFVPFANPNNCAVIPGSSFLRRNVASGRLDATAELVLQALKALHLIHPEQRKFESLEDVCARDDLSLVEDGNTVGRKPASDSIAVASLLLSDDGSFSWDQIEKDTGESFESLRHKCIAATRSGYAERIEVNCARYPGSGSIVKQALETAAIRSISETEEKILLQLQQADSEGKDRLAVALRFRIEERKILGRIAHFQDDIGRRKQPNATNQREPGNLGVKLVAFNSFIESLELPINKIEPKLAGDMRIGAFATEDLAVDDAYISLAPNSVIDVANAVAGEEKTSKFAALLRKYSNLGDPQRNDGFDALLIYLLHERFVRAENSRWWPYLDLLPSIEEMSVFHPLFFQEEDINRHLAGSDIRGFILRYQRRAAERHSALSSDLDANLVLGTEILLDKQKVDWATAVLDSRSIWWDGKRHLSPLLDLVNADVKGRAHETRLEDSKDTGHQVAVTRASRRVLRGEQIFENYAQPNYLLFSYHGFIIEENPNDCALLDGLYIHRSDPGAKNAHRLRSMTPSFCIRDKASVEELAEFFRVKYNLSTENSSESKIDANVRPYLTEVLEERIARLVEATSTKVDVDPSSHARFIRQLLKDDLKHFHHALNTHVLVQN
mmetsp:Transcript_37254/g.78563  ORF Transcript_37254/g.78563 Transcript_37254/m.78563 type:complete len:1056 (+) Transcript_37254:42-3209(+)